MKTFEKALEWRPSELDVPPFLEGKLKISRNVEGKWHCPVTLRVFTRSSHIVAVRSTGNVFSFEAIKNLCIDPHSWLDPLSNQPFHGIEDIIHLQQAPGHEDHSPPSSSAACKSHTSKRKLNRISTFSSKVDESNDINMSSIGQKIIAKARQAQQGRDSSLSDNGKQRAKKKSKKESSLAPGMSAASFTSTTLTPSMPDEEGSHNEEDESRWNRLKAMKKKGYVRLQTTHGDLNIELFVDQCPRTCENFLRLARAGKYDGTLFHRLIPKFMVQGGDSTGTGKGGQSIWGKAFKDEICKDLKHSKRGILSMANSGPDTNTSQFFLTFAPCSHLDGKHTVFGRLVGGFDTLQSIEQVPTDKSDRPQMPIRLNHVLIFVDPVEEERQATSGTTSSSLASTAPVSAALLPEYPLEPALPTTVSQVVKKNKPSQKRPPPQKTEFKNFDAW